MRLILLGAPGVGKGTQGRVIAEKYRIPIIATGDMLRPAVEAGTPLGKQAQEFMVRGDLVPDALIIAMVEHRLSLADAAEGFLLDGFPRTVAQAEALEDVLHRNNWPLDAVIAIDVEEEQLVDRIGGRLTCPQCGSLFHSKNAPPKEEGVCDNCGAALQVRSDDTREAVQQRLVVYKQKTAPLMDFYRRLGLLQRVDGAQSREAVTKDIEAVVR